MKVAPGGIKPTDVQQRRQNNQKDNVGIQRNMGKIRQQRENHPTDKKHNGIRSFETLGDGSQPGDEEHQKKQCELKVMNTGGLHGALPRNSRLTFSKETSVLNKRRLPAEE